LLSQKFSSLQYLAAQGNKWWRSVIIRCSSWFSRLWMVHLHSFYSILLCTVVLLHPPMGFGWSVNPKWAWHDVHQLDESTLVYCLILILFSKSFVVTRNLSLPSQINCVLYRWWCVCSWIMITWFIQNVAPDGFMMFFKTYMMIMIKLKREHDNLEFF